MMIDPCAMTIDHRFSMIPGKEKHVSGDVHNTHNWEDADAFIKGGGGRIPGYGIC